MSENGLVDGGGTPVMVPDDSPHLSYQSTQGRRGIQPVDCRSDLSSVEHIVARRKDLARQFSRLVVGRHGAVDRDAAALRVARDVMEAAPSIAYLTLSGNVRGLVLYANSAAERALGMAVEGLLGLCVHHES